MASMLYVKPASFVPAPGCAILRANEYAEVLEASAVLDRARQEAAAMREEAVRAYEQEKERGYREGLEEGKMEMAMTMLDSLTAGVNYLEGIESTMVDLVMSAVSKVIDGFSDQERVIGVVRKSLGYVRSQKRVVIRVSPEEGDLVTSHLRELQNQYPGIGIIDVSVDPRLAKGDCILESEMGLINASLSTQLEGIRRAFARKLQRGEE